MALTAGDRAGAVNAALRGHGAEVFGFLVGVLGRRDAVAAYRSAAEMARLEIDDDAAGSSSGWLYGVAWRAAAHHADAHGKQPSETEPASATPDPLASTSKRATGRFRRGAAQLRQLLTLDERALVVLRVARGLSWPAIASIQLGARANSRARASRARSIRRQFRILKNALRLEAVARGLLRNE